MSKYGDFSVFFIFYISDFSVFSPNAGKYGPEKSPFLDTFHTMLLPYFSDITMLLQLSNCKKLWTDCIANFKRNLRVHIKKFILHGYFTCSLSLSCSNSFFPSAHFLCLLTLFWCFQRLEKSCIGKKWVKRLLGPALSGTVQGQTLVY